MTAKKSEASVGAKEPLLDCPFLGKKIVIDFNAVLGMYQAKGDFWATKWYKDRDVLYHDLSHRDGITPSFPRKPKITVTERVAPEPNPMADLGPVETTEFQEAQIDRLVKEARLRK